MAHQEKNISKDRTVTVNFCCQRCCQPLKLHPSFRDLDSQTLTELSHSSTERENINNLIETFQNEYNETSVMRKVVLPVKCAEASSDFMFVDELSNLPLDNNQTLRVTAALFDIMSNQSDVDHPLCEECTDNLLDQMDQQLKIAEDECKEYRDFLEHLEMGNEEDDLKKLKSDLKDIEKEESEVRQELALTEVNMQNMKEELKDLENQWEVIQREQDKRWQEYCRVQRQLLLSEDNHRSAENQLNYAQAQFDRLTKTNVFNATFHIWHNGQFGTINNFRMGRLPHVPVEWNEINAGWGQTVLLLYSLAKKINLTFERYRLVPYGNHSYIETVESKPKEIPLYCIGGIRYISDHKFNGGMAAFIDCLQQFKEKIESGSSFRLPYDMDKKGKIHDKSSNTTYSIKTQFNSEEQWTKALKFMLTNLKWALAYVSTQFQASNQS